MAEYRAYRVTNQGARAQLTHVKLISVSTFIALAMLINWMITQQAARLFGYSRALGPSLIVGLYAPWEWIFWWGRWHGAARLEPVWELCAREAAYPLLVLAVLTAATIIIARYIARGSTADLYGSARWATTRDVRAAGLIAPRAYVPQAVRRLAARTRLGGL